MQDACVLIIEDEESLRRFLRNALRGQPYRLIEATHGSQGLASAATHLPDLVLLDLGLPDMDGLEVLRELRARSAVPVIIVTARGQEQDKVKGLDGGADDYLTKPFAMGELLARMRACLRRRASVGSEAEEPVFEARGLRVDLARREVSVDDRLVRLTPLEYKLLTECVRHAGKVLTHRHLLREVWNIRDVSLAHYVRILVHQLRPKIEKDPARPQRLLTEPGVGYRLWAE